MPQKPAKALAFATHNHKRCHDEVMAEADQYRTEKQVFKLSLYYLFGHFTAILLQSTLGSYGLGGW